MDKGETYIKMMERAWPDLKDKMPISSMLFSRRLRMLYVLDGKVVRWQEKIDTSNCDKAFPLLEQDQLQAMVANGLDTFSLLQGVWVYANSYKLEPESMEQLWLAFAMKDLCQKSWDGEKWIS